MSIIHELFSPTSYDNPFPIYAALRERGAAVHVPEFGMYLVSRYEDVQRVLKNPELFSSAHMAEGARLKDSRLLDGMNLLIGTDSVISSDPPAHTRLRKLVSVAFTPRAIARLEGRVREITGELIDAILEKDSFDMMADFAVPLPVIVIAEMLGVDPSRRADFKRWSDDIVIGSNFNAVFSEAEIERIIKSRYELADFFREMIEERVEEPKNDLLSDLVRAQVEDDKLSPQEVLTMASVLLIAGNETTTNLIGNATAELLNHPEVEAQLREDPSLIPGFIEEALRYRPPAVMGSRSTTRETTLGDVTLPAGAQLGVLMDSANHDPARFEDPERFDITRNPAHLTFGFGIHFCVGAPLSRLEGKVAFEEILERLPAFSREPGPLEWNPNFHLRGLARLPLRFDSRA
ncbi:cytochrome P450 [Pseudenhygromyxa sp. WMMC2535]|uniref:cytochrome P450 n=1 Tax=Pseudenhygromyxa sp. WMMC2535 TaxID=2712867 RepID=UPI001555A98C|nr:cytochrome P450 [Pseudenhygromyxa sp. WMMC2535]NVB42511.1 cytochrome P450 [Pseudenhygromyxa sp. WMMC2535]